MILEERDGYKEAKASETVKRYDPYDKFKA